MPQNIVAITKARTTASLYGEAAGSFRTARYSEAARGGDKASTVITVPDGRAGRGTTGGCRNEPLPADRLIDRDQGGNRDQGEAASETASAISTAALTANSGARACRARARQRAARLAPP